MLDEQLMMIQNDLVVRMTKTTDYNSVIGMRDVCIQVDYYTRFGFEKKGVARIVLPVVAFKDVETSKYHLQHAKTGDIIGRMFSDWYDINKIVTEHILEQGGILELVKEDVGFHLLPQITKDVPHFTHRTLERTIDMDIPVRVYRNLNRGGFSITQRSLVVAYSDCFELDVSRYMISNSGRSRAQSTGVRNVHARVEGYIRTPSILDCDKRLFLTYSPFDNDGFKFIDKESDFTKKVDDIDASHTLKAKDGEMYGCWKKISVL